ncbi:hypothetical protein IVB38_39860 [Bradyrhizobium sp. 38]|uniref:hypothetical protein n=1 Tax=unclassified Bradyrhizobium TaxID=2631580 RepID=UPI001FF9B398|nr:MULTISPECIES: hypothetical protein [unclassified Bradyrhizobium]MCK1341963.1 hypothetical protein [Bradyrhizobium sp. 38]MCK1781928.1 hypothetical protein [Bradyrhizobium sp. 132]
MHGFCNLCTKFRELSQDHVPPQGSTSLRRAELKNLLDAFRATRDGQQARYHEGAGYLPRSRRRLTQNGVKFLSICKDCNNRLLGGRYDPEINRISAEISSLAKAAAGGLLVLPERVSVTVKTHFLLRGIIGHLIASIQSPDPSKPLPAYQLDKLAALRDYFFDETLPLPPNVTFYYWLYPYHETTIVKSLGISSRDGESHILGDLLKFFPVAYYVVYSSNGGLELDVASITGGDCNSLNCHVQLQFDLRNIAPKNWPELQRTSSFYTVMPLQPTIVASASVARGKKGGRSCSPD